MKTVHSGAHATRAERKDMSETIRVTITRQEKYTFLVDFGESIPNIVADEPPLL
jgi:hypothetical protein